MKYIHIDVIKGKFASLQSIYLPKRCVFLLRFQQQHHQRHLLYHSLAPAIPAAAVATVIVAVAVVAVIVAAPEPAAVGSTMEVSKQQSLTAGNQCPNKFNVVGNISTNYCYFG